MSDVSGTSSAPSGMTGAGGGSTIRITGMQSGLDVDSIVKKLMAVEQTKVDKVNQDKQFIQWKQEAYQDIIKDIKDLQNTYFNVANSSTYMLSSNSYSAYSINYGNSNVLTCTAAAGTATGNYQVDIDSLAKSASIESSSLNSQVKVSDVNDWEGKTVKFSISGKETSINIPSNVTDIYDLASQINNQITGNDTLRGNLTASVVSDGTNSYLKFNAAATSNIILSSTQDASFPSDLNILKGGSIYTPSSTTTLAQLGYTGTSTTLDLSYNGVKADPPITLSGSSTLGDLIKAVNTSTSGNVTASIDGLTGKLVLQTKSTGSTSNLTINGDNSLLKSLGLVSDSTTTSISKIGQDAKVSITQPGGAKTTITNANNIFTLNGVNYNLNTTGSTSVTVASDTDKVFNMIKGFIDKYNSIVDKIQTKLTEKKDYDYKPLTDSQRSSMSASQITAWETKAKQGILKNDNNLSSMLQQMRSTFFQSVNGVGLTFGRTTLGLDTSDEVSDGGKIVFAADGENTLKAALRDHPDDVMKLFTQTSSSTDSKTKYNEEGIFQRLNDILVNNVGIAGTSLNSAVLTKYANYQDDYSMAGISGTNTLPDQLYQKTQLIKTMTDALNDKQEAYYQKFSKLETAMTQLNSQSSWLSQMMGG